MPEPTPVPDAAEVLDTTRREWKRAVDLAGLDTQPLLRDAEVAALLAHGNEHGVTIRPDGKMVPASPDASLSPVPPDEADRTIVELCRRWAEGGSPIAADNALRLIAIIDRSLSPAPGGLAEENRALRELVEWTLRMIEGHAADLTGLHESVSGQATAITLDRLSASPPPLPDDEEPGDG